MGKGVHPQKGQNQDADIPILKLLLYKIDESKEQA